MTESLPDGLGRPERQLLRSIRAARFARGLACPRCGNTHVIHWGSFSGRRRFRCRGCNRTFSDLTLTPLMYTKHLSRWPEYIEHLGDARPLRRSAAELRVHVNTVFRWRHRVLSFVRLGGSDALRGTIEIVELRLSAAAKGVRQPAGHARCRGVPRGASAEAGHTLVLVCQPRHGRFVHLHIGRRILDSYLLEATLLPRITTPATLVTTGARWGAYHALCRRAGLGHALAASTGAVRPPDTPLHVQDARNLARPGPLLHVQDAQDVARPDTLLHVQDAQDLARPDTLIHVQDAQDLARPDTLLHVHDAQDLARPDTLLHVDAARDLARRLRVWLVRFRGVSTSYLDDYLYWHRLIDAPSPGEWSRACPALFIRPPSTPGAEDAAS